MGSNHSGDPFVASATEPIVVDGSTVVSAGESHAISARSLRMQAASETHDDIEDIAAGVRAELLGMTGIAHRLLLQA